MPRATHDIVTIETPGLGDRSYLVTDGDVAIVVDPQRDIDRVLAAATARGVRITHVLETHVHNDYVSGGLDLARRTGAAYVLAAGDPVAFERQTIADGETITTGRLFVRAIHTPGHTPHHLSYELRVDGVVRAVFTGGSVLYGATGRTDLVAPDLTEQLTHAQFHSARRLAAELPPETEVLPTHGFGSFCSATQTADVARSTLGLEQTQNPSLTLDEDTFVATLLAGLTAHPTYYAHMAPLNRRGPRPIDLEPPAPLDPTRLSRRIAAGEWVVDIRSRTAFARRHLQGTVSIELGDQFAPYLGWVIPWGVPITLVGGSASEVAAAQRALARIGIDELTATAGPLDDLAATTGIASYPTVDFDELQRARAEGAVCVLDVRRPDEWARGRLRGALHIPFYELEARLDEVPRDREVWVHCGSGFRASIAASLLARAGHRPVLIDDSWHDGLAETNGG